MLLIVLILAIITPAMVLSGDVETEIVGPSNILDWLITNIGAVVAGASIILTGLAVLAKLTPTPKDDKWIAKLLAFLKLWPEKK